MLPFTQGDKFLTPQFTNELSASFFCKVDVVATIRDDRIVRRAVPKTALRDESMADIFKNL